VEKRLVGGKDYAKPIIYSQTRFEGGSIRTEEKEGHNLTLLPEGRKKT